jgi:biopolymer transport protein TolR
MAPNKKAFVSEINVVPYVDVMLVLLIVFMIAAPMMQQGLEVELPATQSAAVLPSDIDHLVLTVKSDGSMFLDVYAVTLEELPGHFSRLVTERGRQLYLQADRSVQYGAVVEVMGMARAAGIERIGMVAEQQEAR